MDSTFYDIQAKINFGLDKFKFNKEKKPYYPLELKDEIIFVDAKVEFSPKLIQ